MPTIDYHRLIDPEAAHRIIAEARSHAPIAIGPLAPEILSDELVRTVLRDDRFVTVRGLGLDLQGITSGPLWDRATANILSLDGAEHHRLRRLVSKAFAPRGAERLRSVIVDIITGLVEPLTAVWTLRRRLRHHLPLSHAGHLHAAGRSTGGLAASFRLDRRHHKDLRVECRRGRSGDPCGVG